MRIGRIIALATGTSATICCLFFIIMITIYGKICLYENYTIIIALEIAMGVFSLPILVKMMLNEINSNERRSD